MVKKEIAIPFVGVLLCFFYFLLSLGNDSWWGINFIGFLSTPQKTSLLILSFGCIVFFKSIVKAIQTTPLSAFNKSAPFLLIIGGFMLYHFQLVDDLYGDAPQFIERLGDSTTKLSPKYLKNLLSLNISNPKLGNLTVLSGIRIASYSFGISHETAFKILGILSGLLFFLLYFNYIKTYIKTTVIQWVLLIMVLLAPFNQLFMGHFEIYAPLFPAFTWYFILLRKLILHRKKKQLVLLVFALVLCVKLHFTAILLVPSFLIGIGLMLQPTRFNSLVNWKNMLLGLITPLSTIGVCAYFFVFKDHVDERVINPSVDIYDRLFLPLFSPASPLDRYNLFSLNHILDFVNITFLWSIAGVFILFILFFFYRKQLQWNKIEIILCGTTLFFFVGVFFAFNPLLSMPIDFDLFSIAAPVFLFFVFLLIEQIDTQEFIKLTGGSILALSLFSLAIFQCNHNRQSLSLRMESVGKHIFKTYWIRSAGDIQAGLNLVKDQPKQYLNRFLSVAEELEKFAVKGNDSEYAHLLWAIGKYYRNNQKNYKAGLDFHLRANAYASDFPSNYIGLMECNYFLKRYPEAYEHSLKLIHYKYPSEKKAIEIAVDCALMAGFDKKALTLIERYLQQWDNENYRVIANDLANKQPTEKTKL